MNHENAAGTLEAPVRRFTGCDGVHLVGLALVEHLDLHDYTLGGYSLGARVALRMLTRTARPARAIIAGQGLTAVTHTSTNGTMRRALTALANGHPIGPGSSEAAAAHWITHLGGDPHALLHVLDPLIATPSSALRSIRTPTLVAAGDHWTALAQPRSTTVIADFLADSPT